MRKTFTAIIEYDPETKQYVGMVPDVPGVHTVGKLRGRSKEEFKRSA